VNSKLTDTYKLVVGKDKNSIAFLYNKYGKKLLFYALKNWNIDEDEAWDLIYKTLYKTIETFNNYVFEDEQKFCSFIFKIFINYLRNHYRDTNRIKEKLNFVHYSEKNSENNFLKTEKEVNEKIIEKDLEEEVPESEMMKLLKEELNYLNEWERILMLLRAQNMPYSEIVKYVDKPEEQLKVYYQRLKNKIMQNINFKLSSISKINAE